LGVFSFVWQCSFFPVAEKTNQKKLVASIAGLEGWHPSIPLKRRAMLFFILSVVGVAQVATL